MGSVEDFIKECVERDALGCVTKKELYGAYVRFCEERGYIPATKRALGMYILQNELALDGWAKVNKKSRRVWRGIRVKC